MPNVGLNEGILMHKGKMLDALTSHVDMSHIGAIAAPTEPTHLGTKDLWAFKRKQDTPFINISGIDQTNVIYTEDDFVTYDILAETDASISIVGDVSGNDEIGKGGQPFELMVNSHRLGGHGQKFKFNRMTDPEFLVTDSPIRQVGENWIYVVKRVDSDKPVNKAYLKPGAKITLLGSEKSPEFGQSYNSFAGLKGPGRNKYIVPVGQYEQNVHYHMTTKVCEYGGGSGTITMSAQDKAAYDGLFEHYFSMTGFETSGLTTMSDALRVNPDGFKAAIQAGNVKVALSTMYDSLALKYLMRGEREDMMWGTGGVRNMGGLDEYVVAPGAWKQMDTGYKTEYSIPLFSLDTFKAAVTEYFHGKIDYPDTGMEPVLIVETGKGGLELVNGLITSLANTSGFIRNVKDFGTIKGSSSLDLSYTPDFYREYTMAMLATLRFKYNSAFDPIEEDPTWNPTLSTGYKLSSYNFIIYGENELSKNGNIKIIRKKEDNDVKMQVINGTGSHPLTRMMGPGGAKMHVGSDLRSGYSAFFRKKADTLHIMDSTRILKLVAKGPLGFTF